MRPSLFTTFQRRSSFSAEELKEREVSGSNPLADLIRGQIRKSGPVSFAWFMEQALYHPIHGYYSSERTRIGQAGDFFTNVSVGDLFGEILAAQFVELFDLLGAPDRFKILEQGAENAQLAKDIVKALAAEPKSDGWAYWIVEASAKKAANQKAHAGQTSIPIHWVSGLEGLDCFSGIIFCNELLDALPCHLVEHDGEKWNEVRVQEKDRVFDFVLCPIHNPDLIRRVGRLPSPPVAPYRTEVNLAASDWVKSAARAMQRGFILVIDYGFPRHELYSPLRTEGTLTGYHQHQRQKDVLQRPGEIDITAHIDFSAIAEAASSEGCVVLGFTDQHHFMVAAAEQRLLEIERLASAGSIPADQQRFLREYQSLMHPNTMGLAFKYLLLGKGIGAAQAPTGFKYAKDPTTALQLRE
jgi:SAM-dependent MidA family methyltransferase